MSNWTDTINIFIGAVGVILSLLGLFLSTTSHLLEVKARYHLIAIFATMTAYSAVIIPGYLPIEAVYLRLAIFSTSVFAAILMPLLTSLMLHFTGEPRLKSRLFLSICMLLGAYFGMLVSTFYSPVFYSIDDAGIYTRGPLYPVLLVPPVLIMVLNVWGLMIRRERLSKKQYLAFLMYLIIPLVSMIVQMFYYGILATAVGAIIGSMVLFLFILNDQQDRFIKMTEENADRKFAIRILQMRPHFIYNALTSIYYIVEEDPAKAQSVIRDFSIYLRRVFSSITSQVPVPFSEELEHTKAYLAVETARFSDQLNVIYDIRITDFDLPPLTLQPVVENAVKHGIDPEAGQIDITIHTLSSEGCSEIIVENNGEGFVSPLEREEGVGLGSTRERLKRMCDGELTISPREGGGTVVTIRIPHRTARA